MSGRLYLLMMVWAVLQALWPASVVLIELWAVEAFLSDACYCFVSVTFLCKHFMFFIYIMYVCGGVV
jgi:hypothetical protein